MIETAIWWIGAVSLAVGAAVGAIIAIAIAVITAPAVFFFVGTWIGKGWRAALRKQGYYHMDYGFASGRHWWSIDGKLIAQTPADDLWLRDEDIHRLVYALIDKGQHWTKPNGLDGDKSR